MNHLRLLSYAAALALVPACSSNKLNGSDAGSQDSGNADSGNPMESGSGAEGGGDASGPSWSQVGLDGNIITAVAIDPKSPSTIFASAGPGGADVGLFRSKDGGKTWMKLGGAVLPTNLGGGPIAVHPTQNVLLTTVGAAGIFRSTDDGDTWTAAMGGPGDAASITLDPGSSTAWIPDALIGIWISPDGGATWHTLMTMGLPPANTVSLGPMAFDGSKLYLGTGGQGAFVSTDKGSTWTSAGMGLPMGNAKSFVNAVAASGGRPGVALLLTNGAGLFRTDNGGASWTMVNVGANAPGYSALLFDPSTPTTLYVSQTDTQGGTGGLLRSTDDGKTWPVLGPTVGSHAVDVSHADGTIFVGTIGKGVWRYGT
jgi:photosystem II stability/assembly factor-like uncharacterized protein